MTTISYVLKKIKYLVKTAADAGLILFSGQFDKNWYLENNPDVVEARINPLLHFLLFGGFEGRDPGPSFSSHWYIEAYEDVRGSGINPLIHYLRYGKKAGREAGCKDVYQTKTFTLARFYDYSRRKGNLAFEDTPERIYLRRPEVIGSFSGTLEEGEAVCPPAYVSVIEDAVVFGGSNMVMVEQEIILSDELVDFTGEDIGIKSRLIKSRRDNMVTLEYKTESELQIQEGILLSCEHDNNYFHWLVECLPKLILIDELKQFEGVPLLIPKGLHRNLEAALKRVNINNRQLIHLKPNTAYQVKRLIQPSALSRVIDRYQGMPIFNADIVLSHKWISRVSELLKKDIPLPFQRPWRKLFLSRKKGLRALGNREEIELILKERGFQIVELENISLESQIELFSQASMVIAPTGAALTNILFCQPDTKVLIFMSNHEVTNYYFWSILADIARLKMKIIAGERLFNLTNYWSVHDDYVVDAKLVLDEQYTDEEINQVDFSLQIRHRQILEAPNDPINFISDLELKILRNKIRHARTSMEKAFAQNLIDIAATATPPLRLTDDRILVERIGFLIHTPELFNHYKNIFPLLEKNQYILVLYEQTLVPLLDEMQIPYIFIHDVNLKKFVFKYLVTNHVIAQGLSGRWIIEELGLKNIRFMYALGKSRWNFSDWNRVYDLILCFGPHQVERLGFCENTKKLQIGYPRYDEYFKGSIDKNYWLEKLNCDPAKKTIVWLPTKGSLSSVKTFCSIIAGLKNQYNIVVKPHPLSLTEDVQDVALLQQQGFNAIVDELIDNTNLFYIADYVFSDYGGTAFGAIYTDCNLVLLNVPDSEADQLTGEDSADIALRQSIINIDPKNAEELPAILSDLNVWENQKQTRKQLREIYFAPYYGNAAQVVADILKNLDQILGD